MSKEREAFEELPEIKKRLDIKCVHFNGTWYATNPHMGNSFATASYLNGAWMTWQAAKAQAVPEGYVVVPREPSYKMWGGIARHLCRYAQMHERYSPKSLKKYFDMFIGDTPAWLNAEVSDWESDHAFATADIGVFIYKAMVSNCEP